MSEEKVRVSTALAPFYERREGGLRGTSKQGEGYAKEISSQSRKGGVYGNLSLKENKGYCEDGGVSEIQRFLTWETPLALAKKEAK